MAHLMPNRSQHGLEVFMGFPAGAILMNFLTLWPNWVFAPLVPLFRQASRLHTPLKSLAFAGLVLLGSTPSLAKPELDLRPLNQKVTYEEYEELVKYFVSTIPEFQNLWDWQRRSGLPFYFAGGELRGLLGHIDGLLTRFPLEYVREMKAPTIKSLQVLGGSDVDLFAPDGMKRDVSESFIFFDGDYLDILEEKFYRHSLQIGGTSIGKIRVNPSEIQDPFGGLRAYYEGRLDFHWVSEAEFERAKLVDRDGVSRESEALRFIRLTYNMPHLRPDPVAIEKIKNLATSESSKLEFDSNTTEYWIKKGLRKLYHATRTDLVETLKALKEYNLLYTLARKGFHFDSVQGFMPILDELIRLGFGEMDLIYAASLVHSPIDDKIELLNHLNNQTQSPKVMLALFGTAKILLKHQRSVRKPLVDWLISIFPKFYSLKPYKLQIESLETSYQTLVNENFIKLSDQLGLLAISLNSSKSLPEFTYAIDFARRTINPLKLKHTELTIQNGAKQYFSLSPKYNEFKEFYFNYLSGPSKIAYLTQAINQFGPELKISDFKLTWYEKSLLGLYRTAARFSGEPKAKEEVPKPAPSERGGILGHLGICSSALRKGSALFNYR